LFYYVLLLAEHKCNWKKEKNLVDKSRGGFESELLKSVI
jgi:hypothetical protein